MRALRIALATSCVLATAMLALSRVASAADKEKDLRVTVHGTESGDEIHVTSITPAEEK